MDEKIIEEVEKRIEEELIQENITPDMFGYVNEFEKRKKEILKKEYKIDYETLQEKNDGCSID